MIKKNMTQIYIFTNYFYIYQDHFTICILYCKVLSKAAIDAPVLVPVIRLSHDTVIHSPITQCSHTVDTILSLNKHYKMCITLCNRYTSYLKQKTYRTSLKYCIVLHCIALHCIALHCIALHCIALHCIALHCIALHCIALHCIIWQSITLHYITLHYML